MMKIKRIRNWADIKMAELELAKLITHFAQSNKAEGKSPKTVSWYNEMLQDFLSFLQSKGIETTLAEFHVNSIREFIVNQLSDQRET